MRYLSLDWIEAMAAAVGASEEMRALAAGTELGVTQVVTGTPEGTVTYHLSLGSGRVSFGPGPAESEDVRIEQSWETAVGVATLALPAQEAFARGLVRFGGNIERLIGTDPVFVALDAAFASVRAATTYL